MSSISELRGLGETPSMEQILDALELLEKRDIDVADLPVKKLQDRLEQDWQPEGKVLLQPKSITAGLIAPQDPWIVIGSGVGIAPAFTAPWVNAGGGATTAAFFKDTLGFVHFRGRIAGGASGTNAFTLPAGYRPATVAAGDTYPLAGFTGAVAAAAFAYITVGVTSIWYPGAIADVSLSGISFLAEA